MNKEKLKGAKVRVCLGPLYNLYLASSIYLIFFSLSLQTVAPQINCAVPESWTAAFMSSCHRDSRWRDRNPAFIIQRCWSGPGSNTWVKPEGQARHRGRLYYCSAGELDWCVRISHISGYAVALRKYLHTSATHSVDLTELRWLY